MHCHTAWWQWAVELVRCTASLLASSGHLNFCDELPHCLGAVGSGTYAMHCLTAWGRWVVQLMQYTASVPVRSGQWSSC